MVSFPTAYLKKACICAHIVNGLLSQSLEKQGNLQNERTLTMATFKGYVRYFFLFCFSSLKESTFETRKSASSFTSRVSFLLDIFKF